MQGNVQVYNVRIPVSEVADAVDADHWQAAGLGARLERRPRCEAAAAWASCEKNNGIPGRGKPWGATRKHHTGHLVYCNG